MFIIALRFFKQNGKQMGECSGISVIVQLVLVFEPQFSSSVYCQYFQYPESLFSATLPKSLKNLWLFQGNSLS